jgi:hypothetical protein
MMTEFIPYIIAHRIHSFRMGLYPTTKKVKLKEFSEPWINFFEKIKNNKYRFYRNNE